MTKVVILGAGNVARHLYLTFTWVKSISITQIYNHKPKNLTFFKNMVPTTSNLLEIQQADIYILALKDHAIKDVSRKLKDYGGLVVHTSGSISMEALSDFENYGVFYPLQTFSKNKEVDFNEIPICLEANKDSNLEKLEKLAEAISSHVLRVNSQQRKALHIAAVFVSNFTNHLYSFGAEICRENDLPFEILQPLIKETASKIEVLNPINAQTGPAVRNDQGTITTHLKFLTNEQHQHIYRILTQSIQELHGKKL